MKRICFFTLFFFVCSISQPPQVKAVMLVDDAMIGTVLLAGIAIAGVHGMATYYEKTGENPVQALVNGVDHIFQPAILAFQENFVTPESFPAAAAQYVGVEAAVGAKILDIINFVKDSAAGVYSSLKGLIDSNTQEDTSPLPSSPYPTAPVGSVFTNSSGDEFKITGNWVLQSSGYAQQQTEYFYSLVGANPLIYSFSYKDAPGMLAVTPSGSVFILSQGNYNVSGMMQIHTCQAVSTTEDPTYPPPSPVVDYHSIAQDIASSADPQTKEDIINVLVQLPPAQLVTTGAVSPNAELDDAAPPALSSGDVKKFYGQNAVDVANQAAQVSADPLSTPAEISAAQTAAQAADQAAVNAGIQAEPEVETYSDVPLSGFAEPYNPGPFDIPVRFDTFLAHVAATGLFSLPSQYFNSIPGGGSPVYTIEAGQYGTHTVDLSETMGTGLAVLKTVLLACFGFLCIRVVVLKR